MVRLWAGAAQIVNLRLVLVSNFFVYMVRCGDGSLYTGWTTDVEKRVAGHNAGKGAKYTRSRLPVELAYSEKFTSKTQAMKREYVIKKISRREKMKLINYT
ncbi:MAG: GIY-YIG nuclease family protein [Candidatus Andersenbacteria bacterium]|nr:GIY-YIG nuclease family protein [Candidatus Andersenbacteria bacterium]